MNLAPYQGGKRLAGIGLSLGVAGLALTLFGGFAFDAKRALYAYLVAFVYWLGIALGALIMLGAFHAANAKWPVVLRRFLESLPQVIPLFIVLFIPILLGMKTIFPWMTPESFTGHAQHLLEHKRPYLNPSAFVTRAVVYFVSWVVIAWLVRSYSLRQDRDGALSHTRWQRRIAVGSLPLLALTMTFAAFDWMMSLDPVFFSTIFGVWWFAGSFVSCFAVIILAANATREDKNAFGAYLNTEHFHSLGKFLLAFTAFWAYIAFSQFMLIWIANIPEEVPWYLLRVRGGWLWVGVFLVVFHFLVPFFLLLNRGITRTPARLAKVAAWILVVHWIDLYWVLMPHLDPGGPRPTPWDLTAFVGVGGLATWFTLLRMRGTVAVPVRDPYIEDSLRYLPQ